MFRIKFRIKLSQRYVEKVAKDLDFINMKLIIRLFDWK